MVRMDHAGEIRVRMIYLGQLVLLVGTIVGKVIEEMEEKEKNHLDAFDRWVGERHVRQTTMKSVRNETVYTVGIGKTMIFKESSMECIVAVEFVIEDLYINQVQTLLYWEEEGHNWLAICF